jgi:ABC-type branched-subunit amino acid transport system ATPase component
MKSSRALSRVNSLKITDNSGTICPHLEGLNRMSHQTLKMGTAMVPETSVIFNHLTMLIAREDLIDY